MTAISRALRSACVTIAAALVSASGCTVASARAEVPAVLVDSTAASRAELLKVIQQALHRTIIVLADDALTHDSELIVEPSQPRDAQGRYLDGRETRVPDHFRLVRSGSQCVIVHVETKKRWVLHDSHCVAVR
jgi:hypothetical protein